MFRFPAFNLGLMPILFEIGKMQLQQVAQQEWKLIGSINQFIKTELT